MQIFFITLILLSKEHVYCCTFSVILTPHEYLHFYYKLSLDKNYQRMIPPVTGVHVILNRKENAKRVWSTKRSKKQQLSVIYRLYFQ